MSISSRVCRTYPSTEVRASVEDPRRCRCRYRAAPSRRSKRSKSPSDNLQLCERAGLTKRHRKHKISRKVHFPHFDRSAVPAIPSLERLFRATAWKDELWPRGLLDKIDASTVDR